jgi:DNA-directed RNA polymerase specialized sigma24 family protein
MGMRPVVERVLRRWKVPKADVQEVTQDVMVTVLDWWAARGDDPTAADMLEAEAYLAVVARHAAHRHFRQQAPSLERRSPTTPGSSCSTAARGPACRRPPPPRTSRSRKKRARSSPRRSNLDALGAATLPAAWRAFYAWSLLNVSVDVIAESERVPVPTIYNRLRIAREDLRAFVRRSRAGRRSR